MKKTLIIGSSKTIIEVFYNKYKFKNNRVELLAFRKSWHSLFKIDNDYDLIIVSGFHFNICSLSIDSLKEYINNYIYYLNILRKKSKKLILISTNINMRFSCSRVVFFYKNLIDNLNSILTKKNFAILSFDKINFKKDKEFLSIVHRAAHKFFNVPLIDSVFFINNIDQFFLKKKNNIKFYYIKIPRARLLDRLIRIIFG